MKITIFTTETCPRCKLLAAKLHEWGHQVTERLMVEATTEEIADCRMDIGYFPQSAPLLQVEFDRADVPPYWFADVSLFPTGALDEAKLRSILKIFEGTT